MELRIPGRQSPEQVELVCPSLAPKAPASQGRQSVRASFPYVPLPHGMHASSSYWRVVPAGQSTQLLSAVSTVVPATQEVHIDDPALLKLLSSHGSHVSLAPRLYVFSGHSSSPVRSVEGLCPAVAVEQYTAASSDVYSPGPSHGSHVVPLDEKLPGMQEMHDFVSSSVLSPGLHAVHAADPALLKPFSQGLQKSLAPRLYVFSGHSTSAVRSVVGL